MSKVSPDIDQYNNWYIVDLKMMHCGMGKGAKFGPTFSHNALDLHPFPSHDSSFWRSTIYHIVLALKTSCRKRLHSFAIFQLLHTQPDSSNGLHTFHIMHYRCGYCMLEYFQGYSGQGRSYHACSGLQGTLIVTLIGTVTHSAVSTAVLRYMRHT